MYTHILLLSLLQCSHHLGLSWSQDVPTVGYPISPKDIPGDFRKRRQNFRFKENIRLKPPPPDWPSPTLGAADILCDQPEVDSLSPLQAYQAKLQEEYLREQEERSQKRQIQPQRVEDEASVWSSSDEDFKKLLDPNELTKLNKKLAPLLNQQSKIASHLKRGLKQNTERAVAAVTSPRSRRSKIKTTNAPVHQMKNENEIKPIHYIKTSFEQGKTRVRKLKRKKPGKRIAEDENKIKSKRRMKKAKKFAFAIHHSSETESQLASRAEDISRLEKRRGSASKVSSDKGSSSSESVVGSEEEIFTTFRNEFTKGTTATEVVSQESPKTEDSTTTSLPFVKTFTTPKTENLKTTLIPCVKTFTTPKTEDLKTTSIPYVKTFTTPTIEGMKTTFLPYVKPSATSKIFIETSTLTTPHTSWTSENFKNKSTLSVRKIEVREKRKRIKQEMEKVLEEEELEGSFGDRDSEWATSEEEFYVEYNEIRKSADRKIQALKKVRTTQAPTPKFPIISVTPHEAVLGILKNKIISFVDDVLKS